LRATVGDAFEEFDEVEELDGFNELVWPAAVGARRAIVAKIEAIWGLQRRQRRLTVAMLFAASSRMKFGQRVFPGANSGD
jgi:hypothetical protein